ncbi:DedA family protein [Nocardioides sp. SOB77]|uniref:DedA family protein n=1 Tax=Nocardioides oceani TaxID=3058369 RepID=A0ABT8FMF2_9ACTN|nr:DedA family protein [Nocardioides oceani]MDN4175362.1 DedA family protein [Nocardioides oceani]
MSAAWWDVVVGGGFAFAESMLGVGVVLPGEVVVTGIASTVADERRLALLVTVTVGASLGDHVNYWLGRLLGPRLTRSRLVDRIGRRHWDRATDLVRRHGAGAVVVSRLLPVVRTLMAAVAGVAGMPYRRFALASLVGCASWASLWVGAGRAVHRLAGHPALLVALAVVLGVAVLLVRGWRHRARRAGVPGRAPRRT